ncbi:hypothetical protein PA10_00305 [Pseudomonas phage pPa_SNUABM_DT01]|nr:hypothetical protein PA10_00305 [Pseudomonas phage pPa_SNUABM_DT01]
MMNVYHEQEGLVFRKIKGEAGISYIAVPVEQVPDTTKEVPYDLLVRHGNPHTGNCGYYPLSLLLATPDRRWYAAQRANKRPPTEEWVRRTLIALEFGGLPVIH